MLKDKFKVENIPITREFRRVKRFLEDRGEIVLLEDGEEIRHITFFTLNPGPDFFRGGQYHRKKAEKFYIVSGNLQIFLKDMTNNETKVIEATSGQKVTIYPMCAHKFQAITPSQVIEHYPNRYDPEDDFKFSSFDGGKQC